MVSGEEKFVSKSIKGQCHCGDVAFSITVDLPVEQLLRCNCSLCRRKSATMLAIEKANFTLLRGEDSLSCYRWNTGVAAHYFCARCGIYTHHSRRSNPQQYGVNIACFDDTFDCSEAEIKQVDGAALSVG